jgi:hypothetical protein
VGKKKRFFDCRRYNLVNTSPMCFRQEPVLTAGNSCLSGGQN